MRLARSCGTVDDRLRNGHDTALPVSRQHRRGRVMQNKRGEKFYSFSVSSDGSNDFSSCSSKPKLAER